MVKKIFKRISFLLSILLILNIIKTPFVTIMPDQKAYALQSDIKINFQPAKSQIPEEYLPDYGQVYGSRNSLSYGWNIVHENRTTERNAYPDQRMDTYCEAVAGSKWEIALASGTYDVTVSVGDAVYASVNNLNIEGFRYFVGAASTAGQFLDKTENVQVSDGKLTMDGFSNGTKVNYINIVSAARPGNGIGLKAEYYNGKDFNEYVTARTDPTVNFEWNTKSPVTGIKKDVYSVRWTGFIEPRFTETYTITTETHGGIRLWIDGKLLANEWDVKNNITKNIPVPLEAGKRYEIKMEYCQDSGSGSAKLSWSSAHQPIQIVPMSQLYPPFIPETPQIINKSSTSTSVTIGWNPVKDVTGYDIEENGVVIDNGSNTTYTHNNLPSNTAYTYRVRSKIPGLASGWSQPATVNTQLAVPANINTTAAIDSITVSWNAVNAAASYDIEADGVIQNVTGTSYMHKGLMPDTRHTYRVRAKNASSTGDWSSLIEKNNLSDKPTNIIATATSTSITLTWDGVADATGYSVEADGKVIENGANTSFVHSGLSPNTSHTYRVRAVRKAGPGEWSGFITRSTLPKPGNGTGLQAEYFDKADFTNLKVFNLNTKIDFDWGTKEPLPGINKDNYSARWSGLVEPRYTETYTFYSEAHGGVKLWVNGKLLFNAIEEHNMTHPSGSITLEAGKRYDIKLEYSQTNGTSKVNLMWSSPSQVKEIIPTSQLYPIGVPEIIKAIAQLTSINVSWSGATNATGYHIEADGILIDTKTLTEYNHTGLVPGTMHTYRVRAVSSIAVGEWSPAFTKATLLGKPENFNFGKVSEYEISMKWDAVTGAVGYDIEVDGSIINNGANIEYLHKGLLPGTMHRYRVRARSEYVTGEWTTLYTNWTLPDVPKNIKTSATSHSITLDWDDVTGSTGYEIELYGYNMVINNGSASVYTQNNLNANTQKAYRVRAYNTSGPGKWSAVVAHTTLPDVPGNLQASASDKSVTVTWERSAGAASYDLEVDGTVIYSTLTSYSHNNLLPNTTHKYRVRARNSEGASAWSNLVTSVTLPSVPSNLSAVAGSTSVTLTWNKVEGAAGYQLEVDGAIVDNGTSSTYVHNGLVPGSEHVYRVRAKNGSIFSSWSDSVRVIVLTGVPQNLKAQASMNEIIVTWDMLSGAIGFEIEADGVVIDNGISTTYVHKGLVPFSRHNYRVRAKNAGGVGQWSQIVSAVTQMSVPGNIAAAPTSDSIKLTWSAVAGVTGYDMLVDGKMIDNGNSTEFIHTGLEPFTLHIYRVRAKNGETTGGWSDPVTRYTLVGIPANIRAAAVTNEITVMWDAVEGATTYEIEADGTVIDIGNSTTYVHKGLLPTSQHTYRVRARNQDGAGLWSGSSQWSTTLIIITPPDIPTGLHASATINKITLTWDKVLNAKSYDVEADGELFEDITGESFEHYGLEPNTFHLYRVRAKNEGGISEWSAKLAKNTMPELQINVGMDNIFNFVMVAPRKEGEFIRTLVVNYNPEELEVLDLCAITPQVELTTGNAAGTDIYVQSFASGEIRYVIRNADKTVVNSIKFRAKTNGHSKVRYTIE